MDLKEISRDLRAFGSVPFYIIVVIRATIDLYSVFIWQLLIAAACLIILFFLTKQSDFHIANAFVLTVFTSLFYQNILFTVFAVILLGFIVASSHYLKIKNKSIIYGILTGVVCSVISFLISNLIK